MFRKRKSAVRDDPMKSGSRIKAKRRVEQKEVELKIILMGICRRVDLTFSQNEKKTLALQSSRSSLCGLHSSRYEGEKD